jgi:hypothetical protein
MNRASIRAEVRRRLGDNTAFWTDANINDSINEGLEEMAEASEYYETSETENLSASSPIYDLSSLLDNDILRVSSIWNTQKEQWMQPTGPHLLNRKYARWEAITGEPESYYFRGLWHLRFFPKVAASSGTFTVYYSAVPPLLALDTQSPGFPEEYHYGLVEYALYDLLSQDQETNEALLHWAEYLGYEAGLFRWVKDRGNRAGVMGDNSAGI